MYLANESLSISLTFCTLLASRVVDRQADSRRILSLLLTQDDTSEKWKGASFTALPGEAMKLQKEIASPKSKKDGKTTTSIETKSFPSFAEH